MRIRFFTGLMVGFALLLAGCATSNQMAFQDDKQVVVDGGKPIFLMSVNLKNSYRPSYQPRAIVVHLEKPNAKDGSDRINFTIDDKAKLVEDDSANTGNTYLLRMELDPGQYEIKGLTSRVRSFFTPGMFFTPMHSRIDAKASGVYYLGHVSGTVRERQGNEFRAGAPVPLIDQAVVGASGGTFDVVIKDDLVVDEVMFRRRFPALTHVNIQKAILPAFDRAKAQALWEAQ